MEIHSVLEKYGLSRETTTRYIDSITRSNQTQTADELSVSRDTVNRYKNAFSQMSYKERLLLISTLTQDDLLENISDE